MLRTRVGRTEVETHPPTIPDLGGSQNGSLEDCSLKTVKMVDPISRIRFEVCVKEDYQRECHV